MRDWFLSERKIFRTREMKMLQSILQQKVLQALIYISKIYAERNEFIEH